MAKKNAELQKLIARINDEVASGKASVLSGRYDDGLKHFKTADSLLPQDQKEFSGGKLAEIAGLLSSAAQNEPDKDKQTLLKNEAVNYAKKFGADSRQRAVALRIGKGRRRCKKYQEALKEFTLAVQKDASNPLYFYELGKVQYTMKKYSEARSSFESSAKFDPSFYQAWFNAALAYNRLGRIDDAMGALRKAISVNAQYDTAWLQLARFQVQKTTAAGQSLHTTKCWE